MNDSRQLYVIYGVCPRVWVGRRRPVAVAPRGAGLGLGEEMALTPPGCWHWGLDGHLPQAAQAMAQDKTAS